jgi:hypothetical protein
MSRKCVCEQLLGSEFVQVRMKLVPAAARWVWLMLAKAMAVSDEPGVLRFGSGVGLFALVSAIASVSETEAETELGNLIAVGLLTRTADDMIALPAPQRAVSKRADAARINGLRGGRPRKTDAERAQSSLPLPLPGGADEKPNRNQTAAASVSPTTTSTSSSVSSSCETETEWVPIAREACEAAGFNEASGLHTFGIVKEWITAGASRDLILEVIAAKAGPHVRSLRYFDKAIREAVQTAKARPSAPAQPQWEREARARWNEAVEQWQLRSMVGVMPNLQAYLAEGREKAA